jgi:5,10-methylene-tetrahydrofolate dehydrogenase/methenyl tetrahydrofolate cyclohydrolase
MGKPLSLMWAQPLIESGKKQLIGDAGFQAATAVTGAITQVPSGVGPMIFMV